VAQVGDYFPTKQEALSSILGLTKEKNGGDDGDGGGGGLMGGDD
jgi:hypothetical protein